VTVLKRKAEYLCQELGILDKVIFFGNSNEIDKILSYTDLFCCHLKQKVWSGCIRSYGLGVPVISSNSGGLSEVNFEGIWLLERCWEYR
jgi:glycosyltransferase involved in cell wall biosynthesis